MKRRCPFSEEQLAALRGACRAELRLAALYAFGTRRKLDCELAALFSEHLPWSARLELELVVAEALGLESAELIDLQRMPLVFRFGVIDEGDPTCASFVPVACDVFISEATFGLPVFRHGDPTHETGKLLRSLALFPERAHLVGVYALGKAQRLIALTRAAGYDGPIYLHGALETITRYYAARFDLGPLRLAREVGRPDFAGAIVLAPPSALQDVWMRRFPDPITCFASGWMRVRARARQRGVELPLVISDHCDWDGLTRVIPATGAGDIWVTHGAEEALVHWCGTQGLRARPLHLVGYGEEEEAAAAESNPGALEDQGGAA